MWPVDHHRLGRSEVNKESTGDSVWPVGHHRLGRSEVNKESTGDSVWPVDHHLSGRSEVNKESTGDSVWPVVRKVRGQQRKPGRQCVACWSPNTLSTVSEHRSQRRKSFNFLCFKNLNFLV